VTTFDPIAAARADLKAGKLKRAMQRCKSVLMMNQSLSLTELRRLEDLLPQIAASSTDNLREQCESLAASVATRKNMLLGETLVQRESRKLLKTWPTPSDGESPRSNHDPLLVAVARAADAGSLCPTLRLLLPSGIVIGRPGPSTGFLEAMRIPLASELLDDPQTSREQAGEIVAHLLQSVHEQVDVRESDLLTAVTLFEATWQSNTGGGIEHIPAMRIPLATVTAWWFAGGIPVAAKKGGPLWFAGMSVPLGSDELPIDDL
jgi:hypothetical protein